MIFSKENRNHTFNGILLVALFSFLAFSLADLSFFKNLHLSPLIIGIILGVIYAQTLRPDLPKSWNAGITFSGKKLLRLGIILYGFRLTFQEILDVGLLGFIMALTMISTTFLLGIFLGKKVFKMDSDLTVLISAGSAVCGAAAVLASESVLKAKPYKSIIAVGTVVVFGTLSIIVFPLFYSVLNISPELFGIWVGGSVHEVAQVVAIGDIVEGAADNAVIVKMTRVILLVPLLFILGKYFVQTSKEKLSFLKKFTKKPSEKKNSFEIPWFAILFLVMIGVNSLLQTAPEPIAQYFKILHGYILTFDTFLLTMAMTALGMETSFKKFKEVGATPFYLSFILFLWLIFGGIFMIKFLPGLLG